MFICNCFKRPLIALHGGGVFFTCYFKKITGMVSGGMYFYHSNRFMFYIIVLLLFTTFATYYYLVVRLYCITCIYHRSNNC